jgi:group II intron reverse transcriptase/maturase
MHRVNRETLIAQHCKQERGKASGVDDVSKDEYGASLEGNINSLLDRMKSFKYQPQPALRVYVPKDDKGNMRPLGLPACEDKLVQGAMADVLNEICEPMFYDFSYGFRKGKSQHDAVKHLNSKIMGRTSWVLDADIKGFFDHVDHGWMMKFIEYDIQDKNFLLYIDRFLKAGVMDQGKFFNLEEGVPQGGLISPVLANVYLHFTVDMWFEKAIKSSSRGDASMTRYADDVVMCFQFEDDARRCRAELETRLAKFGLELSPAKTHVLRFGRFAGKRAGQFDFLGFTWYCGKTRDGKFCALILTSEKKLKQKRKNIKQWLRKNMHEPVGWIVKQLNAKLRGHYNYYGVNRNFPRVHNYHQYVVAQLKHTLSRRSQKGVISKEKMAKILKHFPLEAPHLTWSLWEKAEDLSRSRMP